MRRLVLLSLLLLFACPTLASQWKEVSFESDGCVWYVDQESVRRRDSYVVAWVMQTCSKYQSLSRNRHYLSMKQFYYFDCSQRTATPTQQITYPAQFGEGEPVESLDRQLDKTAFFDMAPDTSGERILKHSCEFAASQSRKPPTKDADTKGAK